MRACVFALAMTAVAQPALASQHHKSSHHSSHRQHVTQSRHHHAHFARHGRHRLRVARAPRAATTPGAAAPQFFARTDATDSPSGQGSWGWSQGAQNFQQQPGWQSQPSAGAFDTSRNKVARAETWRSQASPTGSSPTPSWRPEPRQTRARARPHDGALDAMIARHAAANGVPAELVRRVVMRESGYNPRARNAGALGLMQIKHATARSMGYSGSAAGLLDAETNLTYAVKYLAGAYHAAGGNQGRAIALYASGYRGRGAVVARRHAPSETLAQNGWGMQAQPAAMQGSEVVMARRHVYRHRAR